MHVNGCRRFSWLFGLIAIAFAGGLGGTGCGGASTNARPAHGATGTAKTGGGPNRTITDATHLKYFADYDPDDYSGGNGDADNDDIKGPKDRDNDADNKTGSYYDRDDNSFRAFGHAARPADRKAITALVRRYIAVAAAGDGASACTLLYSALAKAVPETYGQPPGPAYLRGKTCAEVTTKLYARDHEQLHAYLRTLEVTGVRLDHNTGLVVLRFTGLPGRRIEVERERKGWKIGALLDRELP
jgi:hypothetical protein